MAGKGDNTRPRFISKIKWDENHNRTFGNKKRETTTLLACLRCEGFGYYYENNQKVICEDCRGTGVRHEQNTI